MTEQNNTRFQIRLPIILAVTLAVGMFIGQQLPHFDKQIRLAPAYQPGGVASSIDEILRYIESRYVDTIKVNDLKTGAIDHLLEQLDPHSVYISPDELAAIEDEMSGDFEGIGIEFMMLDDTIQVVTPLSGGPSEAAGVLAGDRIVTINDSVVAGVKIDNGSIFKKLRGEKGSKVNLGILRGREKKLRKYTITRDVIPVKSVDVAYMLDDRTAYVRITRFSARTYQEFMEAVRPLSEEKSMQDLVLDLRGNPGGYLEEATDLLSQFFPEGKLLVYTKGRFEGRNEYKSNGRARFPIRNIAVLIDEGSASASEIVAGAVQDWDRGWVIGRRSFGKGLVQEQYPLSDGGALRLTVARYFTPSGRCIQRDYKNDDDYDHDADRRLKNGELSDASMIKLADSTKYYTGMGRVVFGGGGIIPDVFIPIDTSYTSDYYFEIRQMIPPFASRWIENDTHIPLPKTLDAFLHSYQISDEMLEALVKHAADQGVPRNAADLSDCRAELKLQLKARIAKMLFGDEGLYAVFNDDDPAIDKALKVLRSGEPVARK
ncbi:MAG: S41 family peptidase [Saprospiraceae bacterium]